jgi:RHS repeat-associated protein
VISTFRKFRCNDNASGGFHFWNRGCCDREYQFFGGGAPFAINAQGQLLMGDVSSATTTTFNVREYNRDGTPDTSFNGSGTASVTISGEATGLILQMQTNGQILVGAAGAGKDFLLARFNTDGSLDTTFGTGGSQTGAVVGAGLAMITAANGETIMVGDRNGSAGIVLEEFHTLARSQTLYVEYDADYNVTSLTNSSGGVVERYSYDPYGTVTVLNPTGTVRGDGTIASSDFNWVYTFQGGRIDPASGLVQFQARDMNTGLGRWIKQDPAGYVNGPNVYQLELSSPIDYVDPEKSKGTGKVIPAQMARERR